MEEGQIAPRRGVASAHPWRATDCQRRGGRGEAKASVEVRLQAMGLLYEARLLRRRVRADDRLCEGGEDVHSRPSDGQATFSDCRRGARAYFPGRRARGSPSLPHSGSPGARTESSSFRALRTRRAPSSTTCPPLSSRCERGEGHPPEALAVRTRTRAADGSEVEDPDSSAPQQPRARRRADGAAEGRRGRSSQALSGEASARSCVGRCRDLGRAPSDKGPELVASPAAADDAPRARCRRAQIAVQRRGVADTSSHKGAAEARYRWVQIAQRRGVGELAARKAAEGGVEESSRYLLRRGVAELRRDRPLARRLERHRTERRGVGEADRQSRTFVR